MSPPLLSTPAALALGLAAGLSLAVSLPPWPVATGAWPLGILGAALLFSALLGRRLGSRLLVGAAAGLALYVPGLWWMTEFSAPGFAVVAALEAAILALTLTLVPAGRERTGWAAMLAFPAALVLASALRSAWPFGGLPLAGLDLGQVDGPLAPAARLGGGLALVALVGLAGTGLAAAAGRVRGERRWSLAAAGVALPLVLAGVAGGVLVSDGHPVGRRTVAVVQGGGPRGFRAVDTDERLVFEAHRRASTAIAGPVDLVLWPEDVIDIDRLAGSPESDAVGDLAGRLGATVVAGVVEGIGPCPPPDGGVCRYLNTAVAWGPDGRPLDRTLKVHRVPFGEYVPFRPFFSRLGDVSAVPRDALAGRGPGSLDTPAGPLGVLISFEVFFMERARSAVATGPGRGAGELVLVPTNASSYRTAQVPAQELAAARLRALETGRWVLQAAPTGYSAVIDHGGRVLARTPLGDRAVLQATVDLRRGTTPAVRWGSWPVVIGSVLALIWANLSGISATWLSVHLGCRRRDGET